MTQRPEHEITFELRETFNKFQQLAEEAQQVGLSVYCSRQPEFYFVGHDPRSIEPTRYKELNINKTEFRRY